MDTALVCIAKNEDCYINEWLRYNLKLGFSHIFVYQNNWRATLADDLICNDHIHLIEWDVPNNTNAQLNCYNAFIINHWHEFSWTAFFDVDEFLVLKDGICIDDFLKKHPNDIALKVHWRLFGDNGLQSVEDGNFSVVDRFTKSAALPSQQVKTLLHTSLAKDSQRMVGHVCSPASPIDVNSNEAELAHYMCKTWQEFFSRRAGSDSFFYGKVDEFKNANIEKMRAFFNGKNKNDIENYDVYDFMHRKDT